MLDKDIKPNILAMPFIPFLLFFFVFSLPFYKIVQFPFLCLFVLLISIAFLLA